MLFQIYLASKAIKWAGGINVQVPENTNNDVLPLLLGGLVLAKFGGAF